MNSNKKILLALKIAAVLFIILITLSIFSYPFPKPCLRCSLLYQVSYFTFSVLGLTAFFLPVILVLFFLRKVNGIKRWFTLSLKLWLPLLINLALIRELFEIETNIGGIAERIFSFARDRNIDFLFVFIVIMALDILCLYLLGVDIKDFFNKIWKAIKTIFIKEDDIRSEEHDAGQENEEDK
jgi:hypothetical protein